MILDARKARGAARGVLWDLDARRPILNCCWANTAIGEFDIIETDAAGRRLWECLYEDLLTGRKEWVTIGPDRSAAAADRACPARGVMRASLVRRKKRRCRGRIEWIPQT